MKKTKKIVIVSCIIFLGVVFLNSQEKQIKSENPAGTTNTTTLETQKDKVSYIIGWDIGNNLKRQSIDVNFNALTKGLKNALSGTKPLLTENEMQEVMSNFQKEMQTKQTEMRKKIADKNKKEGEEFLAKNKTNKNVITLPSGLQYKVIKEGTGERPQITDTVTVHYRGTLIDGTEFDSSYKRGQPATFPVNGVIKGWTEALQLMKTGSRWELYIPSELAYGQQGAGQNIGPNCVLIFDVELLSIEKKDNQSKPDNLKK